MSKNLILISILLSMLLFGHASAALVGQWNFDNSNANDSSGNGHNGTLTGDAAIITDAERGKVLWLDGAGDYVDLGTGAWTNPTNMTIAAWFKVDAFTDAYQTIIAKGVYTYRLGRTSSNNRLQVYMDYDTNHNYHSITGTTSVNVGWHHAAVTYDGTNMKLYIDGVQEGGNVALSALNTNSENLMIGRCLNNNSRDWQGWIDDVRFYNNALTATEIAGLAGSTISGTVGTLNGATMNGLPGNPVTVGGAYTATVIYGWSGTVTPIKTGYYFDPVSRTYSNVIANYSGQDYATTSPPSSYTISGSVGLDGVTMSGLPGNPLSSGSGLYSATVNAGWSGTVAPALTGYRFTPTNKTYSSVASNFSNENYTPAVADLEGSWTFEDGSTSDFSGNGRNGTLMTGASVVYDEERGYVLSLNGSTGYMNIAGYKGILGTAGRTTCGWFKANANNGTIIGWGTDSAGAKWQCKIDPDTASFPNVIRQGVSSGYRTGTSQLVDGQWHHVATVLDSDGTPNTNEIKIYVDGIEEAYTYTKDQAINTISNYDVSIGNYGGIDYFDGMIDDVQIFNRALSAKEIRELADIYDNSEIDPNLLGCWKFDTIIGDQALDSSLNHQDATITGALAVAGKNGQALDFDGVDFVTIPSGIFSNLNKEATIAMWTYGDSSLPIIHSIFYGANASNQRVLNVHLPWTGASIIFDAGHSGTGDTTNTNYDRISKTAESANQYKGQWNHWAFTKDTVSGEMKAYLNGQLWASGTGKTKSMSGITQFKLGAKYDGTSNYPGVIDDFRIYNKALTAHQIQQLAEINTYIGFWSFDDGGPNDVSGNDRHGILMGDAEIVNDPQRGNVLSLDGNGDYMNLGNASWTNPGNYFTIAAWVKPDFDSPYQTIIAKGDETFRLCRYGQTSNSIAFYTNADQNSIGTTNVNDGQWHHVAATYDGFYMKLYIDGIQQPDVTPLDQLDTTIDPLWVGGNSDSSRFFKGLIDDVQIYDTVLSSEEILDLAQIQTCICSGADFNCDCQIDYKDLMMLSNMWLLSDGVIQATAPNEGYLQAYYKFNSASGNVAYDSSGHNRNGTIQAVDLQDVWGGNGYENNCIVFDGNFGIAVPAEVFSNVSNGMTISTWVNVGENLVSSAQFMGGLADPNLWDNVSWNPGVVEDSNSIWMHYAFVKDASNGIMSIYYNGLLVAQNREAVIPINGSQAGISYIGSKSDNSGDYFVGMMDEFKIYNYAMSQAEVIYLAKGPSGQVLQPIKPVMTSIDPFEDGVINLRDFAALANQWLLDPVTP